MDLSILRSPRPAAALVALLLALALAPPVQAATLEERSNKGVVELETGNAAGPSVRIAEDLANVIDDGATRRVLPIVGKGSLQNLVDLKALHGVDLAIVQSDVLNYARDRKLYPGLEQAFTYIAKLYNEEFHLLARDDIKSVADLAGKKVNVDVRGGGTAITAGRLFDLLKVKIEPTRDNEEVALEKLRKGEIAAIAYVAGKPAPLFRSVTASDGLHLLPIPLNPAITNVYVPTRLTAKDYPDLVPADHPVDTVAVGAVLLAANFPSQSERYHNIANFVDAFFTEFQTLLEPGHHPKWREVNLAAELPGWRRFPPAEQWLKRNAAATAMNADQLKEIFSRFIDERRQITGGGAMTQQQKDELFAQFERWQAGQAK
jgi:TRAP transporter TAXI family solute receptor